MGKPVEDLFEVLQATVSRNDIRRIVLEEGGWEGEALHVTRSGVHVWVDWRVTYLDIPGIAEGGKISVIRDITARKTAEEKLNRANRALNALNTCNHLLVRATDEQRFLEDLCWLMVETCGYCLAWVGYIEEGPGKAVSPVASAGYEEGYLESLNITWEDEERGKGPTGTAIRTRRPVACRDILNVPEFAPWRDDAAKRGYASSIALPLMADNQLYGSINIYSGEKDAFDENEIRLLKEMAEDLAFGIFTIRLRADLSP